MVGRYVDGGRGGIVGVNDSGMGDAKRMEHVHLIDYLEG